MQSQSIDIFDYESLEQKLTDYQIALLLREKVDNGTKVSIQIISDSNAQIQSMLLNKGNQFLGKTNSLALNANTNLSSILSPGCSLLADSSDQISLNLNRNLEKYFKGPCLGSGNIQQLQGKKNSIAQSVITIQTYSLKGSQMNQLDHSKTQSNIYEQNYLYQRLDLAVEDYLAGKFIPESKQKVGQIHQLAMKEIIKNKQTITQKKIFTVIALQSLYYEAQMANSLGFLDEALNLFEQCLRKFYIRDILLLGHINLLMGQICIRKLQLINALEYTFQALLIFEKVGWKIEIADCLVQYALIEGNLQNFKKAKILCYEAIALYKSQLNENDQKIGETYYTLGYIFFLSKCYDISIEYLSQVIKINENKINNAQVNKSYNLLGIINHINQNIDQAVEFYLKACENPKVLTSIQYAQILNNLALAEFARKKYQKAKGIFQEIEQIYRKYQNCKNNLFQKFLSNKNLKLKKKKIKQ